MLAANTAIEFGIVEFLISEVFSLTVGVICMFMYRLYFRGVLDRNESLAKSFILFAPSVTAVFWAIHYSLPLSLGLLGALSIVRFRNPIKKAEDIGFIMLVIAESLLSSGSRFFAAGILLAIFIITILVKSFVVDKRFRHLKLGTHLSIFTLIRSKDIEKSDKEIRSALLQEFRELTNGNLILSDVVPKDDSYSLRYSAYIKRYNESVIPKMIARLDRMEDMERAEVFRG